MIALYQGKSLLSRVIQVKTWSRFSHAAWVTEDSRMIEAWKGGVSEWPSLHHNHKPGTRVTLLTMDYSPGQRAAIEEFLRGQLGKPFDNRGLRGFLWRCDALQNPQAWFCSELIFTAHLAARIRLLERVAAHRVFPAMLWWSPLLREAGELVVTQPPGASTPEAMAMEAICV